jgi:hypothetical protein
MASKLPTRSTRSRKAAQADAAKSRTTAHVPTAKGLPASVRDELAARMIAIQSAALAATLDREAGVPASKSDVSRLVSAFATSDGLTHVEGLTLASLRESAGGSARVKSLGVPESIVVSANETAATHAREACATVRVYRRGRSVRMTATLPSKS